MFAIVTSVRVHGQPKIAYLAVINNGEAECDLRSARILWVLNKKLASRYDGETARLICSCCIFNRKTIPVEIDNFDRLLHGKWRMNTKRSYA